MISFNDPNYRRKLVMKHYTSPIFKSKELPGINISVYSKKCVDELHLGIEVKDGLINDAKWDGIGCAVFQSSTDIFISKIVNKSISQLKLIANEFNSLIKSKDTNEDLLEELLIYKNVGKQLNRIHCAEMIILAVNKFLEII